MAFDPANIVLDDEEQWIEDHLEDFTPSENQEEQRRQLMEAASRNIAARQEKKPVTINLDGRVISYFKGLAAETGTAYQVLINLYLLQCAEEKKRPVFA